MIPQSSSPNPIPSDPKRNRQITLIHVGKRELGLSRDEYEALLYGATRKTSSAEMSDRELDLTLSAMKTAGFSPRQARPSHSEPGRIGPRQIYYIEGLWKLASRSKSDEALRKLVRRVAGVDDIRFATRAQATSIILALRDIAAKAGYDPDAPPGRSSL